MRYSSALLSLVLTVSLCAQDYLANPKKKILKDDTPILEAPTLGTRDYFRAHFSNPMPEISLRGPARLPDFLVDDHLELSLRGYLELVLANNTQIAIQKLLIEPQTNAITRAFATFDPTVSTSFRATRIVNPTATELEGANVLSRLNQVGTFSYNQTLETGTRYSAGFSGGRQTTNSQFATVNPSLDASFDVSVTQPLLRNRGRKVNLIPVMVAKTRLKQSKYNLEDELLSLIATAEDAYWAVVDARENLRVNQDALELAETTLKRYERELELGAISELDIYRPQQDKATREILVTQARYRLLQTLDALRRQMGADLDPDFQHVPIVLTEPVMPPENEPTIDSEEMVRAALQRRPDLMSIATAIEVNELDYKSAQNQLLPDLSLSLNYSSNGLGGNTFRNGMMIPGGLGDAINQVFTYDFPTYGFVLSLQLPVRNRRAIANLADAAVDKKLNTLRQRNTEQTIRLQVLNAVNQLESSKARVILSQTSLDFARKQLEAEQKKYDLGVTTIFFLLDAQNVLAEAESDLVTQASAYRRNLTNLLELTGSLLEERGVVIQ